MVRQNRKGNNLKWKNNLFVGVLAVGLASPAIAQQTNTLEIIKELQRRIEELENKVQSLERGQTNAPSTTNAFPSMTPAEYEGGAAKGTATVSLGGNGLVVRSGDSNFLMNIHGYIQADGRFYLGNETAAKDTFLLRRVRPIIEGTVFERFDYRLMADFGSGNVSSSTPGNNAVLDDAYVNARPWQQFQVQVGKYKSPVGLERLQSTAELLFIENGFPTQLTPNYDLGVQIHNTLFDTPINYAIGIFNGAADAASQDIDTTDEGKDVVGRIFFQPFLRTENSVLSKLGFGVGGSAGHHSGPLPSYKTPGQQTFFSYANTVSAQGLQYRVDPQFFYYWGPFGILGEYVVSSPEVKSSVAGLPSQRFNNTGWQIEGSYFLTGDTNWFRSTSRHLFQPARPLNFRGEGWGALELVARVGQLSLDRDAFPAYVAPGSAREATEFGVGLNWYLNSNLRLYLNYEHTRFDGGSQAKGAVTAGDENAVLGRVQVSF
jgi:phosphate-selective porin OprO/OprP